MTTPFLQVLRSLRFDEDNPRLLDGIDPEAWPALLELTDRSQITLPLGIRCAEALPVSVRERIEGNLASNRKRHERLFDEYCLIADALRADAVEFLLLKGFSQTPFYADEFCHRPQYDIDIYCPPEFLRPAYEALARIGYEPVHLRQRRTDHLPPMIRNKNWKWKGDYYDADLPLTVELHFRFWDRESERIPARRAEGFWDRRTSRTIHGIEIPMLSVTDGLSYSAFHLVRHLLRGDLRIYHVYELAHFLHHTAACDSFWKRWRDETPESPPLLEAIAFRLASEWFGCRMHAHAHEAIARLPAPAAQWFELFAFSPVLALEEPNKDELFLHLSLLESAIDRLHVITRRLFPLRPPKLVNQSQMKQTRFAIQRARHHARAVVPLIRGFFRWCLRAA